MKQFLRPRKGVKDQLWPQVMREANDDSGVFLHKLTLTYSKPLVCYALVWTHMVIIAGHVSVPEKMVIFGSMTWGVIMLSLWRKI